MPAMSLTKRRLLLVALLCLAFAAVLATGGSGALAQVPGYGPPPATTNPAPSTSTPSKVSHSGRLSAAANGALKFDKTKITVRHGKVTLTLTNPDGSGPDHAIAIKSGKLSKRGKLAGPGETSRVSVRLKKGTYTYYCPVSGHASAGMKGKLVVR